jgi:hypothetical protein
MVNLWIGLCRGAEGLPTAIKDHGYREQAIEQQLFVRGMESTVTPEILLYSERLRHTILLEWKSGDNTEADQLERYNAITEDDLRERAYIPAVACEQHDITLIGKAESVERLKIGVEAGKYRFPMLSADERGLQLFFNTFSIDQLNQLFAEVFAIDWEAVPDRYVPIDSESQTWEVASEVLPVLVEAMTDRNPRLHVEVIATQICRLSWSHMGRGGKEGIKARIREALTTAAAEELSEYLAWEAGGDGAVRIRNNPIEADPAQRTRALKKLRRQGAALIARLRAGGVQEELDLD